MYNTQVSTYEPFTRVNKLKDLFVDEVIMKKLC